MEGSQLLGLVSCSATKVLIKTDVTTSRERRTWSITSNFSNSVLDTNTNACIRPLVRSLADCIHPVPQLGRSWTWWCGVHPPRVSYMNLNLPLPYCYVSGQDAPDQLAGSAHTCFAFPIILDAFFPSHSVLSLARNLVLARHVDCIWKIHCLQLRLLPQSQRKSSAAGRRSSKSHLPSLHLPLLLLRLLLSLMHRKVTRNHRSWT